MRMTELGGEMVKSFSCAETAQLVRAALKAAFPGVTFSVRSSTYSGGASIDVNWTDGPTTKELEKVAHKFAGATFDGMIDLMEYHTSTYKGERVRFGADFVQCERQVSADLLRECAEKIADEYGVPAPEVRESSYTYRGKVHTSAYIMRDGAPVEPGWSHETAGDKALQLAYATSTHRKRGAAA